MSKILVTGGTGFVGLPLCKKLSQAGNEVLVVDDLTSGVERASRLNGYGRLVALDIGDKDAMRRLVQEERPVHVVHLAAQHYIPECNRRPVQAVNTNVLGTESLLEACSMTDSIKKVIITSSAAVYPVSDRYMTEADAVGPTDIYGITKATNELQAAAYTQRTGIPTVAVRLYNVFGPGETNPHVIPEIVRQIREGATIRLGNVAAKRSYVYVDDVVDGFKSLLDSDTGDEHVVVNLGNSDEASVAEVVDTMSELMKRDIAIEFDAERNRASDRMFLRCDTSKLEQLTGWRARFNIREGLRTLLASEMLL